MTDNDQPDPQEPDAPPAPDPEAPAAEPEPEPEPEVPDVDSSLPFEDYAAALTGAYVMKIRKQHKLSRMEFSQLCGFTGATPSRVNTIETKEKFRRDDRERVARALRKLLGVEDTDTTVHFTEKSAGASAQLSFTETGGTTYELTLPFDDDDPWLNNGGKIGDVAIPEGIDAWAEEFAIAETAPIVMSRLGSPGLTPVPDRGVRISNGMFTTWNRCKRKWWLSWYRKLAPVGEDFFGIRSTGIRLHKALAAYYVPAGQTPTHPQEALERALTEDWTHIVNRLRESQFIENFEAAQSEMWSKFNQAAMLERAMIEGYVEWLAETGADAELEVIASETPRSAIVGAINNGDTPVQAVALIDTRVRRVSDGARLFMDNKSVQDFTRSVKTLHMNPQMLMYHLVEWLDTPEGEQRCDGALYNMLRRVKRTGNAKPPFYQREHIPHSVVELESFRRQILGAAQDMWNAARRLDNGEDPLMVTYPTKTQDCSWDCDFFAICPMFDDGSRVDAAISMTYTEHDPWSRYDNLDPTMEAEPAQALT